VDLGVLRRLGRCFLCLVQRLVQAGARSEGPCESKPGAAGASVVQCLRVRGVGFVEAAAGPKRVAEQGSGFCVSGFALIEQVRLAPRHLEFGDAERRPYLALARAKDETFVAGLGNLFVRAEGFPVSRRLVQLGGQLVLC
jgi:hypothetical protein